MSLCARLLLEAPAFRLLSKFMIVLSGITVLDYNFSQKQKSAVKTNTLKINILPDLSALSNQQR